MMQSWQEHIKFRFGNNTNDEYYDVCVPGAPDNEDTNVEDGSHSMTTYARLLS